MADEPLNNEQIEPSSPLPINAQGSEPSNMPLEAPEAPKNADIPVSLNNPNPENNPILTPSPEEPKPEELPAEGAKTEEIPPVSVEPVQTSETRTAQMAGNEPLAPEPEPTKQGPVSSPSSNEVKQEVKPEPVIVPVPIIIPPKNSIYELLNKAKNAIQFRKKKKLDKVMSLFLQKSKITNDDVEKFLHISDATAERYLNILEKENKIKQVGKTGHAVSYSRI